MAVKGIDSITRRESLCKALVIAGGFAWALAEGQTSLPTVSHSAAAPNANACATLIGMKVESGTVEGAEEFAKGEAIVGGETAGATAGANLCRARLRLHPAPGSDIKVEVWLPETWNNKMFGFGGAGFDGGLSPGSAPLLNKVVIEGYAAVATDVGHKPGLPLEQWVHKQPEKLVDFGHRGNHLAAVVAKQVIAAYYDRSSKHAYFLGCSNGGRDALMLATRYPEDYDGVVAGAPARRYLEVLTQLLWSYQTIHGPGGAPNLGSKLGLVHEAVMKKCDRIDGVKDGVLENPQLCDFDAAELQCNGADATSCLTDNEVGALRKIYGGPRLSSGEPISRGLALGSEGSPNNWTAGVIPKETAMYGQDFYRWMAFDDPTWKVENYQLDRDYPAARARVAPIVNVGGADLSAFAKRGGKLIIYHGWDDPIVPAADTVDYFEDVRKHVGPATDDNVRLFMVPGMIHCAGGTSATSFDMQPVLEKWVERGEAPERVIAVKLDSKEPFSRPLCAWPKTAHYNGSGSTSDAANFTCKAPR